MAGSLAGRSAWALPFLMLAVSAGPQLGAEQLRIPKIGTQPRLSEFLAMELDEAPHGMARIEGLLARTPRDGEPISERTVVYLGYDDEQIHAVFVCFDRSPEGVRAHLWGRDRLPDSDDSIALHLDTFRDLKHAYGFQANPYGVQQDGTWTEGKGWDLSFDAVWRSEGAVTDRGYVVLLSIPFRSLRFSRDEQAAWGLFVYRGIARKNEECFWPAYSSRIAGRLQQSATLARPQGVSGGRGLDLLPHTLFRSTHVASAGAVSETALGLDAKAVIGGTAALDLTLHPDFSQVETDEPQLTVNRRFEVAFPEKRPFFLENASTFETPLTLLFTRRIRQPPWGARATGRVGPYAFGGLVLADAPDGAPRSQVAVARLNRDLGAESTLGAFWSSLRQGERTELTAAADARLKLAANWVATLQAARAGGHATHASLVRTGRRLSYAASWNERSRDFRTALGFIERVDFRGVEQAVGYRWRPASGRLLSFGPDLIAAQSWDRAGRPLETSLAPRFTLEWAGQTTLAVSAHGVRERLRPEEVPALDRDRRFDERRLGIQLATSPSRLLSASASIVAGTSVNLTPAPAREVAAARVLEWTSDLELRPTSVLSARLSYLYTRLADSRTGSTILADRILRARADYQFSRATSLRAIVHYDRLATHRGLSGLQPDRGLDLDFQLAHVRSAGSALYLGYSSQLDAPDPLRTRRLRGSAWQLYLKASYLLRR